MNFKQMILIEYLLNNILNGYGDYRYALVFEIDNCLCIGKFASTNENQQYTIPQYTKGLGFLSEKSIFNITKLDELRPALINKVFKKDDRVNNRAFNQYTEKLQHLVLNDVIEVISELNAEEYFSKDVVVPEIVFNFNNLETKTKLDYYRATGKTFQPVSFKDAQLVSLD